jgi:hypothetical protein
LAAEWTQHEGVVMMTMRRQRMSSIFGRGSRIRGGLP